MARYVSSGTSYNLTVTGETCYVLNSGTSVVSTTVNSGGLLDVYNRAAAVVTVVNSSGKFNVSSGDMPAASR